MRESEVPLSFFTNRRLLADRQAEKRIGEAIDISLIQRVGERSRIEAVEKGLESFLLGEDFVFRQVGNCFIAVFPLPFQRINDVCA